jgi:hypothetical protein
MPAMRWKQAAIAIAALFVVSHGALILIALFLENGIPIANHWAVAQKAWSEIGQEPTGRVAPVLDRLDPIVSAPGGRMRA